MTRLYNDPADFADEMVDGFVAANGGYVRRIPGGVLRAVPSPEGRVAVVIGGGSGHYPAFGGLVGFGLASGAAMGNLFASPSAQQVKSVALAAHRGGGVLFAYGNYAGDVLNFDAAARALDAEGIRVRTVQVTDDVASAGPDEKHKRRGIAGDLCVFKIAGAAAELGLGLDEVAALAERANARTRSFGVAFTGCSLPGADEPLFSVAPGRMAVGLGIHGERGIAETDIPTADGLARLLVERVLGELPDDVVTARGARAAVVLNGLGAVKYEELFVLYRSVQRLLADAGITIVQPEVGELVTSFDMAGVSLTLFWLDDELERLWADVADSPAYRKGAAPVASVAGGEPAVAAPQARYDIGSEESQRTAAVIARALVGVRETIDMYAHELGRIDAVAGDGDHGIGMQRGAQAAERAILDAVSRGAGAGTALAAAGDAWSDRAGGTSGALWGAALESVAGAIGDEVSPTPEMVADAAHRALDAILAFGAAVGDKTMVDAVVPFSLILSSRIREGATLADAWADASSAAREAADSTAALLPRIGRARTHAEQALGTPDAGAVSFAIVVDSAQRSVREQS